MTTALKTNRRLFAGMAATLALAAVGFAGTAQARDNVSFSVGIGVPGVQVGVTNAYPVYQSYPVYQAPVYQAPVYVQPQPVYVQPRPVYVQPRPVYIQPQPVYYPRPHYYRPGFGPRPIVYAPAGYPPGYRHGHGHGHRR